MEEKDSLEIARDEIRLLTEEIIGLLGERMRLIKQVSAIKEAKGLPVEDVNVERKLRRLVVEKSRDCGLDPSLSLKILNILLNESVSFQLKEKREKSLTPTEMLQRARQVEKEKGEVIHLEAGELDFPTPKPIVKALKESVDLGFTRYSDPKGIDPLREALSEHLSEKFSIDLSKDQVIITHGARFALYLALSRLLNSGGESLIFEPAYPAFKRCVEYLDGRPLMFRTELEDKWVPDFDRLENMFQDPPDVMILNYPANPTGKILDKDSLSRLVDLSSKKKVPIISDEVYMDYSFKSFSSILEYPDCRSIMISSFSKSYSMAGLRLGYAIASRNEIEIMSRIQGLVLTCLPEFVQRAAIRALKCEDEVSENVEAIRRRADMVNNLLSNSGIASIYKPEGGIYLFPRIDTPGFNSESFAIDLLEKHRVSVTPGSAFGGYHKHIRLSLCQPEDRLIEAVNRIKEMLI